MKLNLDGINYNLVVDESKISESIIPIIFIHGFTGSAEDWIFISNLLPEKFLPISIDLIGHGKSDSPSDPKFYSCTYITNHLNSIINYFQFNKVILIGYSMGGRIALSYSLKFPDKLLGLILESTTAGIEDIEEKKKRVEHDLILAEKILNDGVENFIDYWFNTPLFLPLQKLKNINEIINKRKFNNPIGLANTLKSFSTGLMNSYWDKLNKLDFPVLLISGEDDEKYTQQNKRMVKLFTKAKHEIVSNTSHNVHLEKPHLFTNLVLDFLNNF